MTKRLSLFLVLLSLAPNAWGGKRFGPNVRFEKISDVSGGLYTAAKAHKIPHNFSPSIQNGYVDEKQGTFVGGNGFALLGSTPTLQNGKDIFIYNKQDGSKEFLVSDGSSVLRTTDFNTYTLLRSGLNGQQDTRFTEFRFKVWATNELDAVWTWDGTTVTILDGQNYSGNQTPNVPRGKFITNYQERVWMGDINSNDSMLNYSALTDTNNVIIAPDSGGAWPTFNFLPVGEGDGTAITFLRVFNSVLRVGKDNSIYTVFGNQKNSYVAQPTVNSVGFISDFSLAELDGKLLGHSREGVFAFDGTSMQRKTDLIKPNMEALRVDKSRTVNNTWDTQADFLRGGQFSGTTVTAAGFLTLRSDTFTINTIGPTLPVNNNIGTLNDTITMSTYMVTVATVSLDASYLAVNPIVTLWEKANGLIARKLTARNLRTGAEWYVYEKNSPLNFDKVTYNLKCSTTAGANWISGDVSGSSFALQIRLVQYSFPGSDLEACDPGGEVGPPSGASYSFYSSSTPANSNIILNPSTTGQYISEISTISTITSWGIFDSVRDPNGGSISYYIRNSTALVIMATQTWVTISPGSVINSTPSNKYVQWDSTIAATSTSAPANIDFVSIGHIEGGAASTRSFGISWKSRYWFFASTETSGNFPVLYVKSKITNPTPDAWMYFNGIPMRSVVQSDGILYGGGATSGAFYRLDYGTSYNGSPIESFYETPDLILGEDASAQFSDKTILEYMIDVDRDTGMTLDIGTSINGRPLSTSTYDISGTGRALKSIYNVDKSGRYFRVHIGNAQLDKTLMWHSIILAYIPILLQ